MDYLKVIGITKQLYNNLLPIPCLLCGQLDNDLCLCQACQSQLPVLARACLRCAEPLYHGDLCGQCLVSPPEQDLSLSLFAYQPPIKQLIAELKYHDQLVLAGLFANLMAQQVVNRTLPQLLIPIPLHPRRLCERGYNQALELAKQLSQQLTIAVDHTVLSRVKDTQAQAELPFSQWKNNMQGAFQLNHDAIPTHIALIDDVLTTGHTVAAAAKILRQAGVTKIEVWTIARTIKTQVNSV